MFHLKYLFYFILLHCILATPQINLHYTLDWINELLQHNCLRFVSSTKQSNSNRKIILYCLSELPSKFHITNNNLIPKYTFAQLSKQNITSQQLYQWSAPIDLIEDYQLYLNQLSISNHSLLETDMFYNCTLPRFGPMCQYEFIYYHSQYSSLYEMIHDFYHIYEYNPTTLTCYIHLQCNRNSFPICLDWTEICDGKLDCFDGGYDEENCWKLEINECKENEYRCKNGQCIPKSFYLDDDDDDDPFCLDKSDIGGRLYFNFHSCDANEPSFSCEDMTCDDTFLTSSCMSTRKYLILRTIFSVKDNSISETCWSAIKCFLNLPVSTKIFCKEFCMKDECIKIIETNCTDMFYFPNVPLFFGDIYLAYSKSDIPYLLTSVPQLPYICYNNSRYDDYFINNSKILFNNGTCFRPKITIYLQILSDSWIKTYENLLSRLYEQLKVYNPIMNYTTAFCNRPNMYQCRNSSKCISIYRLNDDTLDCPYNDDENVIVDRLKLTGAKMKI